MKPMDSTVATQGSVLVAKSLEELHRFAAKIGLTIEDFNDTPKFPHYRLGTSTVRNLALDAGAKYRSAKETRKIAKMAGGTSSR